MKAKADDGNDQVKFVSALHGNNDLNSTTYVMFPPLPPVFSNPFVPSHKRHLQVSMSAVISDK